MLHNIYGSMWSKDISSKTVVHWIICLIALIIKNIDISFWVKGLEGMRHPYSVLETISGRLIGVLPRITTPVNHPENFANMWDKSRSRTVTMNAGENRPNRVTTLIFFSLLSHSLIACSICATAGRSLPSSCSVPYIVRIILLVDVFRAVWSETSSHTPT